MSDSHTGENLAFSLKSTIAEWELERHGKGPTITTDNASNIVCGVKEANLSPHILCFAHTINLATQRGLHISQTDRLLGKSRKIVFFFHRSTTASAILKNNQAKLELPQHKLIMDVQTRWNSSYDMLERYTEQQAAIFSTLLNKAVKKNLRDLVTLSDGDVENVETLIQVLKPLKTVSKLMYNERNPTVSLIHPLKETLLKQLEVLPGDNALVSAVKTAIINDLRPRYTGPNILKYLHQCSALDPRFRSLPFLKENERHEIFHTLALHAATLDSSQVVVKSEPSKDDSETLTNTTETPALPVLDPSLAVTDGATAQPKDADLDEPVEKKNKCALDELFGDVFVTSVEPPKSIYDRLEVEVQNYKAETVPSLDSSPLQWWRLREEKYPLLSKSVRQSLCVPATSVASERVFSTAGDIVKGASR
ncbi:zinc finger BED domain-containing protein 1-like [Mizuhopecten yessoensis]|uniref:zinc finger BED domain-containing protein 1-like n=1 Tax=Mizuhopecten yessoensis TaxID=6573 RepID=UPI000B45BD40|nr:zinc finger BED domain-containing protein 1-like [Mizuhopecten yessoensis]